MSKKRILIILLLLLAGLLMIAAVPTPDKGSTVQPVRGNILSHPIATDTPAPAQVDAPANPYPAPGENPGWEVPATAGYVSTVGTLPPEIIMWPTQDTKFRPTLPPCYWTGCPNETPEP